MVGDASLPVVIPLFWQITAAGNMDQNANILVVKHLSRVKGSAVVMERSALFQDVIRQSKRMAAADVIPSKRGK